MATPTMATRGRSSGFDPGVLGELVPRLIRNEFVRRLVFDRYAQPGCVQLPSCFWRFVNALGSQDYWSTSSGVTLQKHLNSAV